MSLFIPVPVWLFGMDHWDWNEMVVDGDTLLSEWFHRSYTFALWEKRRDALATVVLWIHTQPLESSWEFCLNLECHTQTNRSDRLNISFRTHINSFSENKVTVEHRVFCMSYTLDICVGISVRFASRKHRSDHWSGTCTEILSFLWFKLYESSNHSGLSSPVHLLLIIIIIINEAYTPRI